jgi:Domain of Unknown Function (DUF1080)
MNVTPATAKDTLRPLEQPSHWRMAGHGSFSRVGAGVVESVGGPGLYWFTQAQFGDFVLELDWRIQDLSDNSGVFVRFPALGSADPDADWRVAVTQGYEIQIDDRGYDPETRTTGSLLHASGAVYRIAPAIRLASHAVGVWNHFRILASGSIIDVTLNGESVARLDRDVGRPRRGHIGLQNHHEGSRVQFRDLAITALA